MVAMMSGSMYCFYDAQAEVSSRVAGLRYCGSDSTGFPSQSLAHWGKKFTDQGYVLVVMDQFTRRKKNGCDEIYREAVGVYGPGNPVDPAAEGDGCVCAVVYLDNAMFDAGYATFESTTGATTACEFSEATFDSMLSCLTGAATADGPSHTLVVYGVGGEAAAEMFRSKAIGSVFGRRVDYKAVDRVTLGEAHVRETIRTAFGGCGLLSEASEAYIGLGGRMNAARAVSHLVHFLYRTGDGRISAMRPPVLAAGGAYMDVATGGLRQLDITGEGGLLARLPACCTAAGRRAFRRRVCRPLVDAADIERRLGLVDLARGRYREIRRCLCDAGDIEAMLRAMARPTGFRVADFVRMARSLESVATAARVLHGDADRGARAMAAAAVIRAYVDESGGEVAYAAGIDAGYDAARAASVNGSRELDAMLDYMSECSGAMRGDRHYREADAPRGQGPEVTVTRKRFEGAQALLRRNARTMSVCGVDVHTGRLSARGHSTRKNDCVVHSSQLDAALRALADARSELAEAESGMHAMACDAVRRLISDDVLYAAGVMEDVDVAAACALMSEEMGFVRPAVSGGGGAHVTATCLRHPIVESLDPRHEYVGNDVSIGGPSPRESGMLVFGINGSGKSCLMKSIGIAVCMAQAGMYVCADSLSISPFHRLFTRIWNNDDIGRGMSTFVVEMTELSDALRRGDRASLVLGDELCSGTERVSATAILSAAVEHLVAADCRFVLATHQHDVVDRLPAGVSARVRIAHLSVDTMSDGTLVYDRRLADGRGGTTYGVTVCRALGMPAEFVEAASRHAKVIQGIDPDYAVPARRSRYNRSVFMGTCGMCKSRPADHTHHRSPQAIAPERSKNAAHNLQALCSACHEEHHRVERARGRVPTRMIQTSSGVMEVVVDIA